MKLASTLLLIVAANVNQSPFSLVRVDAPDAVITNVGWIIPEEKNTSSNASGKPKLDPLGTPTTSTGGGLENPLDRTRGGDEWILAAPASRPPRTSGVSKPTVYVGVKNTGTKTIKAIDWKIIFSDKSDASEYLILEFRTKTAVRAGQELMQSKEFPFDQKWKRLKQDADDKRAKVKALIVGVEYTDGSIWRRQE